MRSYFNENAEILWDRVYPVNLNPVFGPEVCVQCQLFQEQAGATAVNYSSARGGTVARDQKGVISYQLTLSGTSRDTTRIMDTWVDGVIRNNPRSWYQYLFNNNPHSRLYMLLTAVCDYIDQCWVAAGSYASSPSDEDETMRLALRLCIMTCIMSTEIRVSDGALRSLERTAFRGKNIRITGSVAPKMLTMGIKHCLATSLYRSTESCLGQFHDMLRSRDITSRGRGLCLLILLSVIVSLNKMTLSGSPEPNGTTSGRHTSTRIDVCKDSISDMENLLDTLIEYYHNILRTHEILPPGRDWSTLDQTAQTLFRQIFGIYAESGKPSFSDRRYHYESYCLVLTFPFRPSDGFHSPGIQRRANSHRQHSSTC